jgi:hypothetical protein
VHSVVPEALAASGVRPFKGHWFRESLHFLALIFIQAFLKVTRGDSGQHRCAKSVCVGERRGTN